MKEDSIDDLKKKISELEERNTRLHREVMEFINAEKVMIAAGLISEHKVKQAHEIVQDFYMKL